MAVVDGMLPHSLVGDDSWPRRRCFRESAQGLDTTFAERGGERRRLAWASRIQAFGCAAIRHLVPPGVDFIDVIRITAGPGADAYTRL